MNIFGPVMDPDAVTVTRSSPQARSIVDALLEDVFRLLVILRGLTLRLTLSRFSTFHQHLALRRGLVSLNVKVSACDILSQVVALARTFSVFLKSIIPPNA